MDDLIQRYPSMPEPAPLFLIAVPFSAGIFWARQMFGLESSDCMWLSGTLLFCLCIFFISLVDHEEGGFVLDRKYLFCMLAGTIILFSAGYCHERYHFLLLQQESRLLSGLSETGGEFVFSGIVLDAPVPVSVGCRSRVLVESLEEPGGSTPVHETMTVTFKGLAWQQITPGSSIRFAASLGKVRNFKTPGTFDYENWWALRGIKVRGFSASPLKLLVLSQRAGGMSWTGLLHIYIQKLRQGIMNAVSAFFTVNETRAVAMAMLTGERAWFDQELTERFAVSGLGHLLAVSGLHMALVALFAGGMVRFMAGFSQWILLNLNVRLVSCCAAVAACLIYTATAGFSPSSLRAFFMVLCLGLALFFEKNFSPKNSTALAALILLIISPFYLFDVSFQLSFFVVFFLIHLFESLNFSTRTLRAKISKIAVLSAAAFLFAAPLAAFYFQRFSAAAVVLNLAAVPLTEFLILPGLLLGLLSSAAFPSITGMFWQPADLGIRLLTSMASHAASLSWISRHVVPPSISQICLITVLFLMVPLGAVKYRFKKISLAVSLLLVVVTLFHGYEKKHRSTLEFHLVDVGQGLCQVVEFPNGLVMVSDAGGSRSFDMGERVVAPYLRRLGITKIDVLAVSHPEQDHAGGIPSLLRQFRIGELWLNTDDNPALPAWEELLSLAEIKEIPVKRWKRPQFVFLGQDSKIEVLPCMNCPEKKSRNARCLVFKLAFRGRHILMTGDIDYWREKRILSLQGIKSKVMVIPHHGSRTSSSLSFLKAVSPEVALCPVGYKNIFKLPSDAVIKRYKRLGVQVFRTDRDGTIDVQIPQSGRIRVSAYTGRRQEF